MARRLSASMAWTARRAMVAHARREAPNECCGLLVGRKRHVVLAVPMTNAGARPRTGFRIDPAEHFAVRRVLRGLTPALEIVGVYHSHPSGPATPSARDISESHYPHWWFVIVGRSGRAVRAFRIVAGAAEAVSIRWRRPSIRRRTR